MRAIEKIKHKMKAGLVCESLLTNYKIKISDGIPAHLCVLQATQLTIHAKAPNSKGCYFYYFCDGQTSICLCI